MQNGAGHSCRYYLKMDDDDFGGFEAAETFECGSGETHTTSPAIPWAAFPTVSGVHIPPPVSPESLLEQSSSSAHLISSKPIISSQDSTLIVPQTTNNIEQHKRQLEDMKKAGHETLSIITEEYKALLQTTVKQQEESIGKQYVSAIEKQARKCEELLNAQHQRLLDMLDVEKEQLTEKIKEALTRQSQDQKELLGKYLTEEMQRNKDALATAAKIEKETMKDAILKTVEEERKNLKIIHAEEKEIWKAEHDKDQEKISQAIQEALQEQRKISQETLRAAMAEERKQSERAVEEAVKRTKEELMEYVKEQKRLDQVIRQRNLSTLELFLSCAQKQLNSLISEEPASTEEEQEKLTSTDRD
ncbi:coiled-coil domain-containing protein 91 isoform X6 [Antechinus flavipes]|uniref:coiled-coil domain-containing protein 91 isoform X6 n=1 Tax=Antechinus flavipes TaxID=38775 RepID=UPI0022363A10|nr:coiled-coil domain-containing protein 91 isoform X6 [Antechinus flavipes]